MANGGYSKAMGGSFEKGFSYGFVSQGASDSMQYYIESNNPQLQGDAKPTLMPGTGGWDATKSENGYAITSIRYGNIGIGHTGEVTSWMQENSWVMNTANYVPGMNYMSAFHDTWMHATHATNKYWIVASIALAMGMTNELFSMQSANANYLSSLSNKSGYAAMGSDTYGYYQ